jgi:adenine-specific DNA-methyltransferase
MTSVFDYFQLAHPDEGVDSGLRYKTVPHVTLKSIANNEPPEPETLYDQPLVDAGKTRVTGPFTVEAVPAPMVKSPGELSGDETAAPMPADESVARSGATIRQDEWRSEVARRHSRQGRTDDPVFPRRAFLRHALVARRCGDKAE